MTIAIVQPIPAGNALRLFVEPPFGATSWRILRKGSDTFGDENDPTALVAYEGDDKVFVDCAFLPNEQVAFYKPYYRSQSGWSAGATAHGTPSASYQEYTTDTMSLLRERLEAGLAVEIDRGNLQPMAGYIQVFTAPPSLERDLAFPLVTLHLESESSADRSIGEDINGDEFDMTGFEWNESEGWLASVQLNIVGWSLNSDERIELRKALRRILIANMPVLADKGIFQIDVNQQDVDAVNGEYDAPLYQIVTNFSCLAPVRVGHPVDAITDVTVEVTPYEQQAITIEI